MSFLILPDRRIVQPPDGVGVDWSNPVTKDIGGLFDTRSGVELVYNNRASNYTALRAASRAGAAADFSGTANQQYAHRPGYATTNAMTIFALMEVRTLSNFGAVIAKQQTTTVNVPFEFRIGSNVATNSVFNFVRASASSGANTKTTTGNRLAAAPGVPRAVAITVANGLLATIPNAYVDKVKTAFNANSTAGSCTDSAQPVWIGRRYDGATQLDGRIYYVALWNRELSEVEIGSLTDNPWQLFRPIQRPFFFGMGAGGGAVALVPSASSHAHTAENVVLTSNTALTVADAAHAQAADNLTLNTTASVDLTVANASHAQSAENVALSIDVALTVQNAAHAHTAESVVVGAVETLTVANAAHAHSAENVTLTVGGIGLTVADAQHAQDADNLALTSVSSLAVQNAQHSHIADTLPLGIGLSLVTASATHAHSADNLSFTLSFGMQVDNASHAQTAANAVLSVVSWLETADAWHVQTAQNLTLTAIDATRIRPIDAGYSALDIDDEYNTLAIDAGYNTTEIDPTYWID